MAKHGICVHGPAIVRIIWSNIVHLIEQGTHGYTWYTWLDMVHVAEHSMCG